MGGCASKALPDSPTSFYDLHATTIDGEPFEFASLQGKVHHQRQLPPPSAGAAAAAHPNTHPPPPQVVLVCNTASK